MPRLIEVIEFFDDTGSTLIYRFPPDPERAEIKWGAQLTVRESQVAVFFRDGKSLDVFNPGRHVLKTQNLPLLTKMFTSLGYGSKSPFRAEVYFCNMKLFFGLKWGTSEKIPFRDAELDLVRLGAYGAYSLRINDPTLFLNKIAGTKSIFLTTDIEEYLRNIIVSTFQGTLSELTSTVLNLPQIYKKIAVAVKAKLQEEFSLNGLRLEDFFVTSINVPDEVAKKIDDRSGMGVIKDMNEYFKFKAAESIKDAAQQPGGGVGAGLGLGAGVAMGAKVIDSFVSPMGSKAEESPTELIKKLKELYDSGAITQEQFEAKKQELLKRI